LSVITLATPLLTAVVVKPPLRPVLVVVIDLDVVSAFEEARVDVVDVCTAVDSLVVEVAVLLTFLLDDAVLVFEEAAALVAATILLSTLVAELAVKVLSPMIPFPPSLLPAPALTATTFGHSVLTPVPWKNRPIRVVGSARVPTHAVLMLTDMAWSESMQVFEQGFPPEKSLAWQPEIGAL
jgi:hypothetical protein